MFLPALLLGLIIATTLAVVVHLARGQTMRDLVALWLATQVGFWLAQSLASFLHSSWYAVGDLQVVAGLVGGVLAITAQQIATRKRV